MAAVARVPVLDVDCHGLAGHRTRQRGDEQLDAYGSYSACCVSAKPSTLRANSNTNTPEATAGPEEGHAAEPGTIDGRQLRPSAVVQRLPGATIRPS